jgi:hypothetical protein
MQLQFLRGERERESLYVFEVTTISGVNSVDAAELLVPKILTIIE